MTMLGFACRLFVALSVSLVLSIPAHAVETPRVLAWPDCWATTSGVRNQRLAESWINYTLEASVSGELTRRQGLANTIEAGPLASDADNLIWLKPVESLYRRAMLWSNTISGDLPGKFLAP